MAVIVKWSIIILAFVSIAGILHSGKFKEPLRSILCFAVFGLVMLFVTLLNPYFGWW